MSLLLDALRRAGSARGNDIAEPVDRASGADADAGRADRFDLDVDTADAGQESGDASAGPAAGGLKGRARAEAVFRGGASGASVLRTAVLLTLGAFAVVGALLVGGWYYYDSTLRTVDRELVRYNPESETGNDRSSGSGSAGDGADPSAGESVDAEALDTAESGAEEAGAGETSVDVAAALATVARAGSVDGDADADGGAGEQEPAEESSQEASKGDAGTTAANEDAAS
ncbi:MAG: hypothetical protein ACOCP9_01330, partial [Halofilum sp. (in: g-proteobacteria)]